VRLKRFIFLGLFGFLGGHFFEMSGGQLIFQPASSRMTRKTPTQAFASNPESCSGPSPKMWFEPAVITRAGRIWLPLHRRLQLLSADQVPEMLQRLQNVFRHSNLR